MDLFDIKCFLSAAKHLNFSLAAKELFISQPAMSVKINTVEKDFGVKLFNRDSHRVELTPAGVLAQKELAFMLSYYDKVKAEAQKMSISGGNHLSISYWGPTEWANIHELVHDFHQKYPQIELEVRLGYWGQLVSEVIDGSLDLLFCEQSEVLDIAALKSIYLFRDYAALAVPRFSSLAKYEKIKPESFLKEKFSEIFIMANEKNAARSMKRIHERLRNAGFDMENAKLVDDYNMAIAMVSSGIAITPIPRSFKIKGHQSVSYVDIDSDKVYEDFVLTWSARNENSAIGLFKDFCKQHEW